MPMEYGPLMRGGDIPWHLIIADSWKESAISNRYLPRQKDR